MTAQIHYDTEKGVKEMKIAITGSAKEIAALVLAVQGRQKAESLTIGGVSMTAVIYARYSSDNQREESIEGRIRECTAYCSERPV